MRLTAAQQRALDTSHSTAVMAGAGSGKTTLLAERYLRTLANGVPGRAKVTAAEVCAITFTEAAAAELRARIEARAPADTCEALADAPISTIHAFAARLLREEGVCPAGSFTVLPPLARRRFLRSTLGKWLDSEVKRPSGSLGRVLREYSRREILAMLEWLTNNRAKAAEWLGSLEAPLAARSAAMLEEDWARAFGARVSGAEGAARTGLVARLTLAIASVYSDVAAAYRDAKANRGFLDFDDLLEYLDCALDDEPLRARLAGRLAAILVDEAQDVDPVQTRIIEKLTRATNGVHRDGALFVVGDPKQSIYRFRGADPSGFDEIVRITGPSGVAVNLDDNFRTRPPLLDTLNRLFDSLFRSARDEGLQVPSPQSLHAARDEGDRLAEAADPLEVFTVESAREQHHAVADWIASQTGAGMRPNDIAILLRDRNRMSSLAFALAARRISYRLYASGGLFRSRVVADVLNLLDVLSDPADDIALLGFLRGPLAALSDDALAIVAESSGGSFHERMLAADVGALSVVDRDAVAIAKERIARWRTLARVVPVAELLASVACETGAEALYAASDPDEAAHLRRLLAIALASPLADEPSPAAFAEMLRENLHTTEGADDEDDLGRAPPVAGEALVDGAGEPAAGAEERVSIFTVHGAKGLEFPVVVIPNLERPITRPAKRFQLVTLASGCGDGRTELAFGRSEMSPIREIAHAPSISGEKGEELRVLYVAMTRARDRLVLFSSPQKRRSDSWAARLLPALDAAGVKLKPYPHPRPVGTSVVAATRSGEVSPIVSSPEATRRPPEASQPPAYRFPAVLSPSSLHLLVQCPLRYLFAARLRIAEPYPVQAASERAAVPPTTRGSLVHRALELCGNECHPIPFERLFDEFKIADRAARDELAAEVARAIDSWTRDPVGRVARASDLVEREVAIDVLLGPLRVRGAIDLIFATRIDASSGAPAWRVGLVDYKTNRVAGRPLDEIIATNAFDLQLALYAHAARTRFGVESVDAHLFFTDLGSSVRVGFTEKELARALARVENLVVPILDGGFSRSPGADCARCGYGQARLCQDSSTIARLASNGGENGSDPVYP